MSCPSDSASHCFAFEQDFIGNWRCIPLCVRRKLDLCGVKLKLNHWHQLSQDQRQALVDWSDAADALEQLRHHLHDCTRTMADAMAIDLLPVSGAPWQQLAELPAAVQEAATSRDVLLTLEQWEQLSELDRFALCKLARPGHDHHNLEAAFSEVLV